MCASHANAQSLTPTPRHLGDAVIRAIAERDGVIGVVLANNFLAHGWTRRDVTRVIVDVHVRAHLRHIAGIAGWEHVGIGSDLDGGFGRDETPEEIDSVADLHTIGAAVPAAARNGVLGGNWLRFLRSVLG